MKSSQGEDHSSVEAPQIGPVLRAARQAQGLTLDQMAARTGLTKGFLSLVERDMASASVASLVAICAALKIRVGSLFDTVESDLVRDADRRPINFGGIDVQEWLLTRATESRLRVIKSQIEPGGGGGDERYALTGEVEWVHVISGQLEISFPTTEHSLGPGDSLTFNPSEPRRWRNPSSSESTEVLWVIVRPES